MKPLVTVTFLISAMSAVLSAPRPAMAQACQDDESMVTEYKKNLAEVVATVKKESLPEFQKAYHQKTCQNTLKFAQSAASGLLTCLDKAAQDSSATKEEVAAYKAKGETTAKLKTKIGDSLNALKNAADAKGAKAAIESFNFSD